jgi:hypothetical protein
MHSLCKLFCCTLQLTAIYEFGLHVYLLINADDGGHQMDQQIASYVNYFDHVAGS